MTLTENIKQHFHNLENIRNNIKVVNNTALTSIDLIENGILIGYASWSGPAIANFIRTIKLLDHKNYRGQILIFDIGNIKSNLQVQTFGDVLHGWAEVFVINQGAITERFLGAKSFENFKTYADTSTSLFSSNYD